MFAQPPAPHTALEPFLPRSPQTPAQVDYRLLYTQRSLGDLADIIGHIAEDDPEAASRFGNSLLDHIELPLAFHVWVVAFESAREVRKLLHGPILVYYQIREEKRLVEILHLRHASRQSPRL